MSLFRILQLSLLLPLLCVASVYGHIYIVWHPTADGFGNISRLGLDMGLPPLPTQAHWQQWWTQWHTDLLQTWTTPIQGKPEVTPNSVLNGIGSRFQWQVEESPSTPTSAPINNKH